MSGAIPLLLHLDGVDRETLQFPFFLMLVTSHTS